MAPPSAFHPLFQIGLVPLHHVLIVRPHTTHQNIRVGCMKDSTNCRAQAEAFRALAKSQEGEPDRAILLQLSQAWDLLAGAWDSLSSELEPAHQRLGPRRAK